MAFITYLQALFFGILEGITEWLPISSTGHLLLLREVLPAFEDDFFSLFEVVIQLGAILAVPLLFWRSVWPFTGDADDRRRVWRLWGKILLATLPSAAVGFFLGDFIEEKCFRVPVVAAMLILWGIAFFFCRERAGAVRDLSDIGEKNALWVGFFQIFALIPGTSRSGATIIGGLFAGLSRSSAAEFSFLLGIPTMAGAGLYKTVKYFAGGGSFTVRETLTLAVGTAAAFLTSLIVIRFLVGFVRKHGFRLFGIYRILLGAAILLTTLLKNS